MQAFFSSDGSFVVQFLVIFLVILVLLIGAVLLFRRLSGRGLSLTAGAGARGRQPRLGIVDIYELDRQRQLILLRRDNVEHLLLVGGPNDVVIERHIQRGAGARYAPEGTRDPDLAADPALDAARAEKFLDNPVPPAFAMPEVVPPAVPGAEPPHPERTPPLDPGLFEPETPAATSAPAGARPTSPVSRLIRRTPPPLAGAQPETAQNTPIPATPAPAAPSAFAPPASEPPPETPPVIAGRGPRPVDPAVLSDMARQLQVALKRPSSAVTPPPGGAEAAAQPPAPPPAPDPLAAAMTAARAEPSAPTPAPAKPAAAKPVAPPPPPAKPAPAKAETPAAPAPRPADAKPAPEAKPQAAAKPLPASPAPAPLPTPAPTKPDPAKPTEAAAKSAPEPKPAPRPAPPKPEAPKPDPAAPAAESTAQNPFSVEEIEAEFARLLGRPLDNKG